MRRQEGLLGLLAVTVGLTVTVGLAVTVVLARSQLDNQQDWCPGRCNSLFRWPIDVAIPATWWPVMIRLGARLPLARRRPFNWLNSHHAQPG